MRMVFFSKRKIIIEPRNPYGLQYCEGADAQLMLPFVERHRFRSSLETFVLSTEINKHPALRSAGNASCLSVDVDPMLQEPVENSSVRTGKAELLQVRTVGVHLPQYLTKL